MKTNHYFTALITAAAAFTFTGCGENTSSNSPQTPPAASAEIRDYREIYRNDEQLAQRDWAECKKAGGELTDQCRMARQYGQQAYKAPAPGFSSQGGTK